MTNGVFSEYEIREQYIKVTDADDTFVSMSCVGSSEEELEVITVTKKCRGKIIKRRIYGTGSGSLKESIHVPYEVYNKIYNMDQEALVDGVKGYGTENVHPEFALTQRVFDEDGVEKLKAYPRCIMESGPKRSVENGAEEVSELELEITLMPDDSGYCMYEALVNDVDASVVSAWLTDFSTDLVQIPSV